MLHNRALFIVCALFFSVSVFAQAPNAAESCQAPECTVVKRGSATITVADVTAKVRVMEPSQQDAVLSSDKQLNKMLEDMLVLRQIANEVNPAMIKDDVILQAQLKLAQDQVLAVYQLDKIRAERINSDFEQLAREQYLTNLGAMKTPKQIKIRQLLIESKRQGDAAAKAKIDALAASTQSVDEARFAQIVMQSSDDTTKDTNGGIMQTSEGATNVDQDFLSGALALSKVGDVSPPIRSQFGYHLVQLLELTPSKVIPFEQAKSVIIEKLRSEARRRVVLDYRADLTIGEVEIYPQNLQGLIMGDSTQPQK